KEFYSADLTPGAIVLDGELNDWTGVPILADPRFAIPKESGSREGGGELVLFELHNGGDWTGPDDHTSAVQIAYDPDNVYFAFVVTDEYHENSANSAWNGDSVQLMIANDKQDTQVALYNYALGGIETELGDVIVQHEAGPGGENEDFATSAVVKRNTETKRTTYEIKLPKGALGLDELGPGTQFGLGMAINDGDEDTPGQKGWGGLGAHSIVFGKTPQQTALVTLGVVSPPPDECFISAFNSTLNTISFRANNLGDCEVNPDTTRLIVDGEEVELTVTPASLGAIDFSYNLPEPFLSLSRHSYTIELGTNGNPVTDTGEIVAPYFAILTPQLQARNVDRTKPGFIWRVFQNENSARNSLNDTEAALIGELTDDLGEPVDENFADPELFGPADGPGEIVGDAGLVEFAVPEVINFSAEPGGAAGNFAEDLQMPGVPGVNGANNGAKAEIITYVELPAGRLTMGVNSDDGFRMEGGLFDQSELMGQFGTGRGSQDTIFEFDVLEAGIYPIRVIYFNGGGGATIEIFSVMEDGTKVLLNDLENGGYPAFRSAPDEFFITDVVRDGDDVSLTWESREGQLYGVQTSPDLQIWTTMATDLPGLADFTSHTMDGSAADNAELYFRVIEVQPPPLFETDFEDGAEGWMTFVDAGDTVWELGTPAAGGLTGGASGTQAWGTNLAGDYAPGSVARLQSPVIDASEDSSPKLSFNYFIDSTQDLEGGQLRILDENGGTLAIIEEIFSGQSGTWTPFSLRFPSAARGVKVIIEFAFLTDGDGDVGAGWYIDDFKID
ncbi:MAG: sugar-binding protein, partial [Verrucomicrobiota bacterium]